MEHRLFIAGEWTQSRNGETFPSVNPANEKVIGLFQQGDEEDVRAAIDAAGYAYEKWSDTPAPKRGEILFRAAALLRQKKEELAKLETTEMGKVLAESRGDVQEAIDVFEYMAGEGRRLFGHTTPSELRKKFAMTVRRPIGVVGLITPWNFPVAIPAWKLSAALICGNAIVLKPSSDTPLCATELVKIISEAGIPNGVVNLVTGPGGAAGKEIVTNKKVRAVSFTGSRDTGDWIARNAGVKKVGLELGGKNAIIVMDDADLGLALDGAVWGAFGTTGQRCTAASRIIVHEKILKDFERAFVARAKQLVLGSGMEKKTDIGPLVNKAAVEKVERYVGIGKQEGARLLTGGKRAGPKGFFFEPTIFAGAKIDMRIAQEEIFGPVVALIAVKSLDEAIEVCNAVEYGLSSAIYTRNVSSAMKAVEKIEAGLTYVNSPTIGAEAHLPFGGVKQSGTAREGGILGIDEFSEIKTVYIDYSGKLQKAQIDVE